MSQSRLCVWLTPRLALWSEWQRGVCQRRVAVPIDAPACCPWSGASDAARTAELYVDTGQEEVERIASAGFGVGPVGRWQRYRFERLRRRDAQAGRVSWLREHGSLHARASVVTDHWPASIRDWVDDASNHELIFTDAQAVSSVLCWRSRTLSDARLYLYTEGGVARHVACIDGAVCFSRCLDADEDPISALEASLSHITERWMLGGITLDLPPDARQWTSASLARLQTLCSGTVSIRAAESTRDGESIDSLFVDVLMPDWVSRLRRYCAARHPHNPDLARALSSILLKRSMRRLRGTVALSLLIAFAFACYALLAHREHVQRMEAASYQELVVAEELETLQSEALSLSAAPAQTAQLLEQAVELEHAAPIDASEILNLVGRALTRHAHVELDALSWRVVVSSESMQRERWVDDSALYGLDLARLADVPSDKSDRGPMRSLMELQGRVLSGESLKSRQGIAQAFADSIKVEPQVDRCELLESPLSTVLKGQHASTGDRHDWRLRCVLHTRPETRLSVSQR